MGAEVGAFTEAVQSQTMTALRAQYAEVLRHEAELTTTLGERHPAVIEVRAQAQRLRRVIKEEIDRLAQSAHTEFLRTSASEETLAANLDRLKRSAMTTNEALVALRELDRDVQASRAVYEAFLVRSRETGEQQQLDSKNVRVISKAALPLHRSWPPPNTLIAIGTLILGMAAGTGLAFMREAGMLGALFRGFARSASAPSQISVSTAALSQTPAPISTLSQTPASAGWSSQAIQASTGVPVLAVLTKKHMKGPAESDAVLAASVRRQPALEVPVVASPNPKLVHDHPPPV